MSTDLWQNCSVLTQAYVSGLLICIWNFHKIWTIYILMKGTSLDIQTDLQPMFLWLEDYLGNRLTIFCWVH